MYYAKSKRQDGSQPTVTKHLDAVSARASTYGEEVGMKEQARIAGLTHDLGKCGEEFQKVLRGEAQNVDHAASSAALIYCLWKKVNESQKAVIEAVNGHHAGLISFNEVESLLKDSYRGRSYLTINDGKTPALSGPEAYKNTFRYFVHDHPDERLRVPKWNLPDGAGNLETMLYSRMLLSCLVDADYSVSAWEDDKTYFETTQAPQLDAEKCLNSLYEFCNEIRKKSKSNAGVNQIRNRVFDVCGDCGECQPGGLFTLTAPTGTGKTLALLHFALRHAKATGKRRIIIVLPYLTLAEQNAAIYEKIMPSVLVDHSQSRLGEEMREFTSKWNMPFIITTSVKFFESLFARKPTDCRKLHNLAQSIVIFDEAQSLPPHLTASTLKAVNELCERYQMSMVFSTATQPDFDAIPDVNWKPTEILPEHAAYYEQLRRVVVDWQLKERIPLAGIAEKMLQERSVCGIFNLRRHAREVFDRLYEEDPESAFLISTDLCPAHRIHVVEEIRQRLKNGKPCRVAATQCIEAGVDLDFDVLYRALAPLDAIIQAAGRCNRNGRNGMGRVTVFVPDDSKLYPDDWYENAAEIVSRVAQGRGIDIHDPEHIHRYYSELFADARDQQKLTKAIRARDYAAVDKQYRLITSDGEKLIVPYSGMMEDYDAICQELKKSGMTPGLMKEAAPLTITIYDRGNLERFAEPIFLRKKHNQVDSRSGYWVLRKQYENCYTEESGFKLPEMQENNWDMLF
ncbi:MAG: CRISPR-associated helicase Cas3' [Bacteroidales bacterium]|nr:CRISPR-associated helicase Cas3' [Bacteroidales bacterium]